MIFLCWLSFLFHWFQSKSGWRILHSEDQRGNCGIVFFPRSFCKGLPPFDVNSGATALHFYTWCHYIIYMCDLCGFNRRVGIFLTPRICVHSDTRSIGYRQCRALVWILRSDINFQTCALIPVRSAEIRTNANPKSEQTKERSVLQTWCLFGFNFMNAFAFAFAFGRARTYDSVLAFPEKSVFAQHDGKPTNHRHSLNRLIVHI